MTLVILTCVVWKDSNLTWTIYTVNFIYILRHPIYLHICVCVHVRVCACVCAPVRACVCMHISLSFWAAIFNAILFEDEWQGTQIQLFSLFFLHLSKYFLFWTLAANLLGIIKDVILFNWICKLFFCASTGIFNFQTRSSGCGRIHNRYYWTLVSSFFLLLLQLLFDIWHMDESGMFVFPTSMLQTELDRFTFVCVSVCVVT